MHGLINRSVQCFVRDTYGEDAWDDVAGRLGLGHGGFEAMLSYDDAQTRAMVDAVTHRLGKTEEMLLEDVGTYLVSHPNTEAVRRLLRFGGETFADFLHSLDDLPDRARLAVQDLALPGLELVEGDGGESFLHVRTDEAGFAYVMVGVLRAMADDYGALVLLDLKPATDGAATIRINLLDSAFAEGRSFSLATPQVVGSEAGG